MAIQPVEVTVNINKGSTQGTDEAKSQLSSLGDSLKRVGEFAAAIGLERVTEKIVELGKEAASFAIDTSREFEQTKASFDVLLGSQKESSKLLAEIAQYEPHTSFDMTQLNDTAIQIRNYGTAVSQVVPDLKMYGDLSLGNADKLQHLVMAMGEAEAQGRVTLQTFNMLSRGAKIPAVQLLTEYLNTNASAFASATGSMKDFGKANQLTEQDVLSLVHHGKISYQELHDALLQSTEKGGMFFDAMNTHMNTFNGILSSTRTQFQQMALAIMGFDMNQLNKDGSINQHFGELAKGSLFDDMKTNMSNFLTFLQSHKSEIAGFFKTAFTDANTILKNLSGIVKTVKGDLDAFGKWFHDNKETIITFGGIVGIFLLPAIINLGIEAAISGGIMLAKFTVGVLSGVGAILKYLLFSPAYLLAKATDAAETLILIGLYTWDAVVKGASMLATYGLAAATWVLNAALAVLTSPITLVILAIGALMLVGYELMSHWEQVKAIGVQVWNSLVDSIKANINSIIGAINVLLDGLSKISGGKISLHLNEMQYSGNNLSNIGSDFSNFKANPLEKGIGSLVGSLGSAGGTPANASNSQGVTSTKGLTSPINITNYNQFSTPGSAQQLLSNINFQLSTLK